MAHTGQSKRHEDPALAKHGCQGQLIWDAPGTLDTNDLVGEVGVQAHSRTSSCQFDTLVGLGSQKRDLRQADWQVGQGAEKNACHTGDGAGRGNKIEVQNYEQGEPWLDQHYMFLSKKIEGSLCAQAS